MARTSWRYIQYNIICTHTTHMQYIKYLPVSLRNWRSLLLCRQSKRSWKQIIFVRKALSTQEPWRSPRRLRHTSQKRQKRAVKKNAHVYLRSVIKIKPVAFDYTFMIRTYVSSHQKTYCSLCTVCFITVQSSGYAYGYGRRFWNSCQTN